MKSLIHDLKEYARQDFPVPEISTFLSQYKLPQVTLADYVKFKTDKYARHLVHKDEDFEILIVCWQPGQKAPIHGHEGEKCWMRVESGALQVCNYQLDSIEPLALTMIDLVQGERGYLDGPAEIHSVENIFDQPAVSLHIYAKPFSECDIYCLDVGRIERVALVYDSINKELC